MKFNFRKFQSTYFADPKFKKLILNHLERLEKVDAVFQLMFYCHCKGQYLGNDLQKCKEALSHC